MLYLICHTSYVICHMSYFIVPHASHLPALSTQLTTPSYPHTLFCLISYSLSLCLMPHSLCLIPYGLFPILFPMPYSLCLIPRFTPPVSAVLKHAWIQFISFFAVVAFCLFRLNSFVFGHKVSAIRANIDCVMCVMWFDIPLPLLSLPSHSCCTRTRRPILSTRKWTKICSL
jgi:hypothetical protein